MSEPLVRGYVAPHGVGDVRALLAALRDHEATHAARIQPLRADRVHGEDHLRLAALLARRAVDGGRARAADLSAETMLYAAGERQVSRALEKMGLRPETREVAVVAWGRGDAVDAWAAACGWRRDDAVLAGDDAVLDAFGVTAEERALVPREKWGDLVLERVALVDVLKA
jgi:KEOPS complex subunit Cgi121